ncbi:MAG: T9SS type A sorting domain-containing protein, partial [Bacteroidia bacterium]|nr:T9SS type A sorting domain-containing protein [Bacteroidia bacterium]
FIPGNSVSSLGISVSIPPTIQNNASTITGTGGTSSTLCTTVSMEEIHELSSLSIYPNPAHNTFTISLNELKIENGELKMYDVTGRVVHKQALNNQSSIINSQFSPGIYFVRVMAGEKVWQQKLVVE